MALDSTSTYTDVKAQYQNNADYDIDGSVTKARLFIEAIRHLLGIVRAQRATGVDGGGEYEMAPLDQQMNDARAFVRDNSGSNAGSGGGVIHTSMRSFRD